MYVYKFEHELHTEAIFGPQAHTLSGLHILDRQANFLNFRLQTAVPSDLAPPPPYPNWHPLSKNPGSATDWVNLTA